MYRGPDKSLVRPGRKQTRKRVKDARDFNNIEMRAAIKFFFLQGKAPKEIHTILTETLASFLSSRFRTYQPPCNLFPSWSGQGLISTSVAFSFLAGPRTYQHLCSLFPSWSG